VCGIAGRYALDGSPAERSELETMIAAIRHRGPDASGFRVEGALGLGHARLAIIDLSPLGEQPMSNEDGTVWLVYNGEIYNYRELCEELRARGHVFRSRSDSEAIIHAYEEWGPECLSRFNGMWAFAIWDARARRLFCARDRMGVKPLYYRWDGRELLFASEIKALLAARPALREPNRAWLRHLLTTGRLDDDVETAFAGVRQLAGAHSLTLDARGPRIARFWDYRPEARERYDYRRPASTLRELLEDSVRLRLRSDVPVGTCLSGGLDSSAIVGLASRHLEAIHPDGRVNTFSAIYDEPEASEGRYVEIVNRAYDAIGHAVHPRGEELPEVLPKIVWHQDEPTVGPGLVSQWHVMARARGRVKVLLDGQGADELLAGYHDYLPAYLSSLVDRRSPTALAKLLREYRPITATAGRGLALATLRHYTPGPLQRLYRRRLDAEPSDDLHPELAAEAGGTIDGRADVGSRPRFDDALSWTLYDALTRTTLPALLHYEDRNSMAFSIESRVPFLDYRLVEFCLGLPIDLKIRGGLTKLVLRRALADLLPPAVLDRRDKKGYPTPAARWFRGPARGWVREILLDERTRQRRVLDMATVERKLGLHETGARDLSWEIWRWLTTELWFRQLVDDFAPPVAAPRREMRVAEKAAAASPLPLGAGLPGPTGPGMG
jgi:asparagine synthase (glutamine-hydrolysing)